MIFILMNKFDYIYYCLIIILFSMCKFKNVFTVNPSSVHLNFKGKYTSDIKNYEIVVPQRVNKDGNFISHLVSHHHSKRSAKDLDFIFYKIPIGGKDYLIELTPNRKLISPGAVVEIHKENDEKITRKSFTNDTFKKENLGKMFKNLNIRKLKNTECHFSGHVKGENISKAALSTCYGLAGFIQIKKGFYTIEPVADHDPFVEDAYPHILYKADDLENSSVCHTVGELTASIADQLIRKRRESSYSVSTPMYIETLIVMDKTLINHHQDLDCENYVLTVFNMASNLFHDASLGLMMTLTIVRIIRLEVENDEMNLKVNADAKKTLEYFQTWQYEINPGDDSHPNHHDIAVLITRVNVCYSPSSCGLLGLATIGKACDSKLSAALCEDSGLRLGFIIAHEIGHLLGAEHDTPNSTCNGTDADGLKTVMHPHVSLNAQTWSKCSQTYIKAFLDTGMGNCFLDEPEEHHFNVQDLLPGVMYNADFQCKHLITMAARECEMGSTCGSLNCYIPGYACILTHNAPADGTRCGENMWCHDTKCLVVGERPGAIDGNWGEWSAWSDCSRTCGAGVASSLRHCDKPLPSHGGKNCVGERKRYKVCAATVISYLIKYISEEVNVSFVGKPCETGRPSFRDIQCGEFNDWIYPEDGKIHTWKAHYFHDDNPCTLYCVSEEKQVAALRPRVVDGTMCYRGIRDICVGGTCKSLPCDLHFESNAIEDACGVCHGDGTGCEFSEGMETFSKLPKGLTKLVNVPAGTRNVKVEEMSPTLARIIVRDKDTKDIYVRGKTLGMFNIPGSQAWLGMIKKNQEALNIPGPVTKPLSIWIQRLENVTVKWSMALPVEQQRKPEFAWDFLKWGPCSAKCGPGTQKSEPSCMEEKAGLVEDTFCADLEMPSAKVRPCEVTKCEPRWMVGDWKGCAQPGTSKKERKRVVYCIKTIGEGEGESQIVADSECSQPKPHNTEPCENRKKREDTEYNSEINEAFFEGSSTYSTDTSEFGFHKKYDDYLKHFAALSVPQRKSETIPLHLVSSPHFKHYFHVLETPEDYDSDLFSDDETSSANNTTSNSEAQGKVSPDFYKNTFSGHQTDVSHFQTKFLQQEGCQTSKRIKKNLGDFWHKNYQETEKLNKFYPRIENIIKQKIFSTNNPNKNNLETHQKTRNFRKRNFISVFFRNTGIPKKQYFSDPNKSIRNFLNNFNKHQYSKLKQNKNYIAGNYFPFKKRKIMKRKLFGFKNHKKSFNYTSPKLSNLIESLSEDDDFTKKRLLNLIQRDKDDAINSVFKKFKNDEWHDKQSKRTHKLNCLLKPFKRVSMSKNLNDRFLPKLYDEKIGDDFWRGARVLSNNDFDGSGIKKLNLNSEKTPSEEENKIKNFGVNKLMALDKNFYSNPFDPLASGKSNFYSKKPSLKGSHFDLKDLFLENRNKRCRAKVQRNIFNMQKRSIATLHPGTFFYAKYKIKKECLNGNKKKRSSRKWKRPKSKDINAKSGKDVSGNGCGTETRNYLNNLFRDNHPKIFNKQEQKPINEKPVIKMGQLVIDRDPVENQQIEITFQDDEEEEGKPKYLQLPQPSSNEKKVTLKGQQVFDFFQDLQHRSERGAFYRQNGESEKQPNKIEINVKVPDNDKKPENQMEVTTQVFQTTQQQAGSQTSQQSAQTQGQATPKNEQQPSETQNQSPTEAPPQWLTPLTTPASNTSSTETSKTPTSNTSISNAPATQSSVAQTKAESSISTTKPVTQTTTTNQTTTTENTDCPDYDVDETIGNSTETTTESKSKKKKKKGKNKKKKQK